MKVLFLNTTDITGGAGKASYRLFSGIRKRGIHTDMLVMDRKVEDANVHVQKKKYGGFSERVNMHLERLPLKFYPKRQKKPFYVQWKTGLTIETIQRFQPDILHLHWICTGFVSVEMLSKIKIPIVWTLHDMWPFTGGCSHSWDCKAYEFACGRCPQLNSVADRDLSRWVWKRKKKSWKHLRLKVVAPSEWMRDCARRSSIFRGVDVSVIPNGIDMNIFKPIDRKTARRALKLPENRKLILFGALHGRSDPHKGYEYLRKAIALVKASGPIGKETDLAVFGNSGQEGGQEFCMPTHCFGVLHDEFTIALLYSAADVFVAPSLQDNLPNTVMEAMACGAPIAAFRIGGIPDMVDHLTNGYLAKPGDIEDLAAGILHILENEKLREIYSRVSFEKVRNRFFIEEIAEKYIQIYRNILGENGKNR